MAKTHKQIEPQDLQPAGAAAALAWIAEREAASRADIVRLERDLEEAIKDQREQPASKDGHDFDHAVRVAQANLDDAMRRQFQYLKSLREFDRSVAPEKRDSSESITREEGTKLFQMAAIYLRTAGEDLISNIAQSVLEECETPEDVYKLFAPKFRECVTNSINGAIRESHIPSWIGKAVEEVL